MKDYGDEKVLVVPTEFLHHEGLFFEGLRPVVGGDVWRMVLAATSFVRRNSVEEDENFLQVIPYSVFVCGEDVLVYERGSSGGEKRLVGFKSIGIGGHINPSEVPLANDEEYLLSLCREAVEELGMLAGKALLGPLHPIAVLHDRSNAVSRVHLGFVHVVCTDERLPLDDNEVCIKNPKYVPVGELVNEELEVWSQLAVEAIHWEQVKSICKK